LDIQIEEGLKQVYLDHFNIPVDKVKDTVNNPDIQKRINFPNYHIMFSLKKFKNHYLIVDTRPKESTQSLLFSNAFIIHEQLLQISQ